MIMNDIQWYDDPYIGADGHWYIRALFGYLIWRSEWRAPEQMIKRIINRMED